MSGVLYDGQINQVLNWHMSWKIWGGIIKKHEQAQ